MSDKCYITAQQLLEDSFSLAAQVYEDGFRPDLSSVFGAVAHQLVSQCKNIMITKA